MYTLVDDDVVDDVTAGKVQFRFTANSSRSSEE